MSKALWSFLAILYRSEIEKDISYTTKLVSIPKVHKTLKNPRRTSLNVTIILDSSLGPREAVPEYHIYL